MLGFTKQEQGIVLFLIFTLVIGSLVTLYQRFISKETILRANQTTIEDFKKRAQEITDDEDIHYAELDKSIQGPSQNDNATSRQNNHIEDVQEINSTKRVANPSNNGQEKKFLININKANQEELQNLPKIGPVLAKRIITYRERNGLFESFEDLKEVKGIGNATLREIEPYISLK
ncbi:MAG: ComEA family DNA-binding protein [bacterium]